MQTACSEPVAQAMRQLARWDAVEQCWEIFIPLPDRTWCDCTGHDMMDVSMEIDALLESHGIDYNNMSFENQTLRVFGIRFADQS